MLVEEPGTKCHPTGALQGTVPDTPGYWTITTTWLVAGKGTTHLMPTMLMQFSTALSYLTIGWSGLSRSAALHKEWRLRVDEWRRWL